MYTYMDELNMNLNLKWPHSWNELIMFCYYFTLLSKNVGRKVNELVEQLLSINLEKITQDSSSIVLIVISNNHSSFDYIIIWSTIRQLDDVIQDWCINVFVKCISRVNFRTQIKKQTQNLINKNIDLISNLNLWSEVKIESLSLSFCVFSFHLMQIFIYFNYSKFNK